MAHKAQTNPMIGLAVTTALAGAMLTGCTTNAAPRADLSANKAQTALEKGQYSSAIEHAEAAVLAEPRNAAYRAMLGAAYLEAGRFQSAATSFDDAMSLGDNDSRTVLSYALTQVALGQQSKALAVLDDWRDDIDPADLGLAMALAGDPNQGVHILSNAIRGGQNTAKVRQNLAYSYALQGNWRAARLMAAEDVPADKVGDRLAEWAQTARPEYFQQRVAGLLQVTPVADSGQPARLALANHPSSEQLVAEAAAMVPQPQDEAPAQFAMAQSAGELPALGSPTPAMTRPQPDIAPPATFEEAFLAEAPAGATPAQVASSAVNFMAQPVVQKLPARYGAEAAPRDIDAPKSRVASKSSQGRMLASADGSDTHLVQLGSFSSRQGARRAWGIYVQRYPQLNGRDMVITEARVKGKTYFRVSAAGFGASDANAMCGTVKNSGHGCFAYAEGRPLPGAIDKGIRMASR